MEDQAVTVAVVLVSLLIVIGLFITLFACGRRKSCVLGTYERDDENLKMFVIRERTV